MAEAHSAVAFSFTVTHEGWDVNFDREVLNLVWQSGVRSWKKRFARFMNGVHNGVYPGHLESLWVAVIIVVSVHFCGYKVPYDLVEKILPLLPGRTAMWQVTGCAIAAFVLWMCIILSLRYTMKLLLMYKGWMYEARGRGSRISLATKLWLLVVKIFSGYHKPRLYSFQGSLPRLPLPSLHDTMTRYLRSVRPLLDNNNFERMEKLAQEFENGIGRKLQFYLWLKSWWSTNYVSDWWEEYVYLRSRSPLMINSNFYGIDAILMHPSKKQAARAASVIYSSLVCRRLIERQELEPILIQGIVPLCSSQYERVFNTTRIPGTETDRIQHLNDSNHVVVYHKGRYFKLVIYKGRILKPCELQQQIEQILEDDSPPQKGEEKLAALTATDRTTWANARRHFFSRGVNKQSLDLIEKAAFVVALDDEDYEYDENDPIKLDRYGKTLLHGTGYNRWFDKSFTLCIGKNGRIGFNAEHSWGDAAIMSHIWEYVIYEDVLQPRADAAIVAHLAEYLITADTDNRYDEKGNCIGSPELIPPAPARLQWDIRYECQDAIDEALTNANRLIADVDLRIYVHDNYGKGFMKKCRLSPDAFIQMGLQLAYYRDAGKFSLTYEASMTRLFREGRTETVRPCSIESEAWVKAMENPIVKTHEKIDLLKKACAQHQLAYQDAMCGKGIDRHLFCLYVVSKYLEVDSPFLKEVLSEPWRLSTSQTPHGQTSRMDLEKNPECISAGGGFGPVADDGYGVSYIIAGENLLFFHVSNKKSSKQTDCHRFSKNIEKAFEDIKQLFEDNSSNGKS